MRIFIAIFACVIGAATAQGADAPATTQSAPEPTRVTLKLKDAPAAAALRELFERAHIPIAGVGSAGFVQRMEGITVICDLADQPFNLALLELCRQCGVEPEHSPAPGKPMGMIIRPLVGERIPAATRPVATTTVTPFSRRPLPRRPSPPHASVGNGIRMLGPDASWVNGPAVASGPLAVVARGARRTSRVDCEGANALSPQRDLEITFLVMRDPRLRVFAIASQLEIELARDDQGRSLLPAKTPDPPRAQPTANSEQTLWPVTAALAYPAKGSERLALLRGMLHVSVVTRSEPVELVADGKSIAGMQKAGGFQFSVDPLRDSGDSSEMTIKIEAPAGGANAMQETWDLLRSLLHSDAFDVNDRADRLYWTSANVHSFTNNRTFTGMIRFRPYEAFQGDAKAAKRPSKVVWNVPLEVSDLVIPVEFRDLPLP